MPKLLGEFLQERQEPFTLDVYLLERGYCTRTRIPNPDSARFRHRKRQQAIPNCAEVVRAVFSRILLRKKIKNPRKREVRDVEPNVDDEVFSSASATTLYNSCSESDDEEDADYSSSREAEADTNCFNLRSMEDCDNKQLSPISVLEETESQASPLHQKQYNFKKLTKGESSKSMSQRRSKHKSGQEHCMDPLNQYNINKRALQQKKKLLVDCVREVIENERRRDEGGGGKQLRKVLDAEELWKVVCENVWLWSQESIYENNIPHNVRCDFMASLEEWDCDEVSMEIGDAILQDVINEIVTYMI